MDRIFAPWRIRWVARDEQLDDDGCAFCSLQDGGNDREKLVVAESEHAFVLLNNSPYNPGHAMVIPDRHTGDYAALPEPVLFDHARLKQRTIEAIETAFEPDGVNTGLNLGQDSGGSIDDHLHTHVVPRWRGDTNFMPVVGDTKVIVQALDESYEQLRAAFAARDDGRVLGDDRAVQFGE